MTSWWWVRHGPTHAKSMVGWSDIPADLSDRAALDRLSSYLPQGAPVVSSDLSRASDTASAIQGSRPRLADMADLREINFGDWELRSAVEIEREDAHLLRAYYETPGTVAPPAGESWGDVQRRVERAVSVLSGQAADIIVVAHMGVILTQVQKALGITAYQAFARRIDPLSVTCIRDGAHGPETTLINHKP